MYCFAGVSIEVETSERLVPETCAALGKRAANQGGERNAAAATANAVAVSGGPRTRAWPEEASWGKGPGTSRYA